MRNPFVTPFALAVVLASAGAARASFTYPAVVQDVLHLTAAPDCSACHVGTVGIGTVGTAFGKALLDRGARGADEASLRRALDALVAEQHPELAKLRGGSNAVGPEYGCRFAEARGDARASFGGLLVGLAGVLFIVRRRRGDGR